MLRTDGQQAVQGQIQAVQHAPAPVVMIPPPSLRSRFRWYHAVLAVGVLAASGAGTAVFVKVPLISNPSVMSIYMQSVKMIV